MPRLTGRVFSRTSLFSAFWLDVQFGGYLARGAVGHPPAGSPNLQLLTAAYPPTGTVDPQTFGYYTTVTGTLTGTNNFDGAIVDVQLASTAAQVGAGANNRNSGLGLEADLALTITQQPANPLPTITSATLICDLPTDRADRATHPEPDPTRSTAPARALSLPGVTDDYVFAPPGGFTEFDDGTAQLTGRLVSTGDLTDTWQLTMQLGGRVDPGEASHPPSGAPTLGMLPSAYLNQGGTIDPSHWRYYTTATGTLTGTGLNDGGVITLQLLTPVQYGHGANQANTYGGFYGTFAGTVTTPPTNRPITLTGDLELATVCERAAVLPLPILNVPANRPTLPTLTELGIPLQGDHLLWTEFVALGPRLVAPGDEQDWFGGYVEILDNQNLVLHPPQGLAPGTFDVRVVNPTVVSNLMQVDLVVPATPTLRAETSASPTRPLHVLVHPSTNSAQPLSVIALSHLLLPTVAPQVSLDIGNGNPLVVPLAFFHDPVTGLASFVIDGIPPSFTGITMHFQAATIDLATLQFPLTPTDVWPVDF